VQPPDVYSRLIAVEKGDFDAKGWQSGLEAATGQKAEGMANMLYTVTLVGKMPELWKDGKFDKEKQVVFLRRLQSTVRRTQQTAERKCDRTL
jgi:hypothetical protein